VNRLFARLKDITQSLTVDS